MRPAFRWGFKWCPPPIQSLAVRRKNLLFDFGTSLPTVQIFR